MNTKLISIAMGLLLGAYAFIIEPAWVEVSIHPVGQKSDLQSIRVVQLSDLHLHDIGRPEKAVMDEINRIRPDLLILSGDVLDRRENLSVLDAFLTGIDATQVIATLGNWEYWGEVDLKALQSVYTKHGASLLVNREKLFELKGRKVRITGLDDFTAGAPREELLTVPSNADVSILVEHSPGFFESPKVTIQAADESPPFASDNPPSPAQALAAMILG